MQVIWHGTASVEYISSTGSILFDPFLPLEGAAHRTEISEYDGCTDIFVTHGHFDHIVNIPAIVNRNPGARVYCTGTPYSTLADKGVPGENLML